MKSNYTTLAMLALLICVWYVPTPVYADTFVETTIPELDQYSGQSVEVTAVPLVSTFKEDEGYGVWNLLIGNDEQKLLCYEDGFNVEDLRGISEDVDLIINKNEEFKTEGTDLQSIRVRGIYDGESEILNLTEIIYTGGNTQYQIATDPADEADDFDDDQDVEEYRQPVEKYIIYHEVGQPWLYAPAWYHYPVWWGAVWVDVHWWWKPWYTCDLGWYRDRYCSHWRSGYHDPYGYGYNSGYGYSRSDRRRGTHRDQGPKYYDKKYRSQRADSRRDYPSKAYRTPNRDYKTDRYRGVKPRKTDYRKSERMTRSGGKTYRSGSKYSRPSTRSRPSRSSIRSAPSRSGGGRSPASRPSRPSGSRGGRRR